MKESSPAVLGIDIGGTFTDFVLVQDGRLSVHKRLSTPSDPSAALLEGLRFLDPAPQLEVVHGSTIATNALLERRGARTALITTRGFADVIEIGRQDRPDLYALVPRKPPPLIPLSWRFEVVERVTAQGEALIPLEVDSLEAVAARIRAEQIESVAVCLLFSFLNPAHERLAGEFLRAQLGPAVSISLSCDILPEYREYERTSTTVINAYVAPLVDRYLARVEAGLQGRRLHIMQSNGGVITAASARREAARTALSGPAGGAVGAFHVARQAGFEHIISFDMGGTSTDVSLFPGHITYTHDARIGGLPLRLPVVDVHTVGAGGGSIARVDAGGALQVGPQSAGADPGPACYGRSDRPTTSDANLVLGRLDGRHFLGGQMTLDAGRAYAALARLALDMAAGSVEEAAWGVLRVANAAMERAIRAISVERGHDPRDFTLVAFGGAGPLHACDLAQALGIPRVLVPRIPGVLSALGMTLADLVKDYSQTVMAGRDVLNKTGLGTIFGPLEARARAELIDEGLALDAISIERSLDMRYAGQSHEITVPEPAGQTWPEAFHAAHARRYGHRHDDQPVEIVNARLRAVGRGTRPAFEGVPPGPADASAACIGSGPAWFEAGVPEQALHYNRDDLRAGNILSGPAVVFQLDATTVIPPGWQATVDTWGNLLVTQQ